MIKKVFVEPNGETSVFIYIPNFLSEEKAKKTHNWLNSNKTRIPLENGKDISKYEFNFKERKIVLDIFSIIILLI